MSSSVALSRDVLSLLMSSSVALSHSFFFLSLFSFCFESAELLIELSVELLDEFLLVKISDELLDELLFSGELLSGSCRVLE